MGTISARIFPHFVAGAGQASTREITHSFSNIQVKKFKEDSGILHVIFLLPNFVANFFFCVSLISKSVTFSVEKESFEIFLNKWLYIVRKSEREPTFWQMTSSTDILPKILTNVRRGGTLAEFYYPGVRAPW